MEDLRVPVLQSFLFPTIANVYEAGTPKQPNPLLESSQEVVCADWSYTRAPSPFSFRMYAARGRRRLFTICFSPSK